MATSRIFLEEELHAGSHCGSRVSAERETDQAEANSQRSLQENSMPAPYLPAHRAQRASVALRESIKFHELTSRELNSYDSGMTQTDDPTVEIEHPTYHRVTVHLAQLSPKARALAEIIASRTIPTRRWIILESVRTIREMDSNADPCWYTDAEMDAPHQVIWEHWTHWARWPARSVEDVHDYLENEARKLPIGYYPVGCHKGQRVPSAATAADAHLIDKTHVMEVLREEGRPISGSTMDNYRSRPPAGWPQPVKYVGRTPLWDEHQIREYARS